MFLLEKKTLKAFFKQSCRRQSVLVAIIFLAIFTLYNWNLTSQKPVAAVFPEAVGVSPNLSIVHDIMKRYFTPAQPGHFCDNLLKNLTDGTWIRKTEMLRRNDSDVLIAEERDYDRHLEEFRIRRGLHTQLWRDDGKCGHKNFADKNWQISFGDRVGSWCKAKTNKPCCSDLFNGRCGTDCDCSKCVDMRKIYHAEFCEWTPVDRRCKLRYYDTEKACSVMRRLSEIHFVGDSFVRKFARTLILHLRSDLMYGGQYKLYDDVMKKKCVGIDQLYWTECRYMLGGEFKNILLDKSDVCGMDLSRFFLHGIINAASAKHFHNLIKNLAGKVGSFVLVGVGPHDQCNTNLIKKEYLGPAIKFLREYYQQHPEQNRVWPHIVFSLPDKSGLMKAIAYQKMNGNEICDKFSDEISKYCEENNIPVINFRTVTDGVHSYDGAHHVIGVNLVKAQILFNYIDYLIPEPK